MKIVFSLGSILKKYFSKRSEYVKNTDLCSQGPMGKHDHCWSGAAIQFRAENGMGVRFPFPLFTCWDMFFPTWEVRGEREREHGSKCLGPFLPKGLSSIYRGGGEVHFCLIPLVGWEITSESSDLYNKAPATAITSLDL
jgi:hypothetical protein